MRPAVPKRTIAAGVLAAMIASPALSQTPAPSAAPPGQAAAPAPSATAPTTKTFSQEDLDQVVAPIALYPDSLLAQVLMASTYPLEVVLAERWVKANPSLKGKALEDALEKQTWDASVKSLCAFPQVLTMMSEKIDWTQKLGDAFLAQQQDVMAAVQGLRQKASSQGNLKTTEQQKVVTETVQNTTVIKIEPAQPEVVYVPTYNPTVVYGTWPYPAYPPYYYYPPGYVAGGALLGFTAGVIVGGALWGNVNWGRGDIDIDVNRYNNFNRTNIQNNAQNRSFQHNASHRGAVPYRDKGTAQQYGRGQAANSQAREAYRGRADSGRQSLSQTQGAGGRDFSGAGGGGRDFSGSGGGRGGGQGVSASPLGGSSGSRDFSGSRSGAFDTHSGSSARDFSNRGSSSLSSSRSSGMSGAHRGGGGGARAGGGGGRGGGGRR